MTSPETCDHIQPSPLSITLTGIGPEPVGVSWSPTSYSNDPKLMLDSFSIAERGAFLAMCRAIVKAIEETP